MRQYTVAAEDGGIRLDRWFKRHLPEVTHGLLEKALRKGQVRVNGAKAKASDRVEEGQDIRVTLEIEPRAEAKTRVRVWQPSAQEVAELKRCVLYEDKDMLVLNKPAGLAVQGGSGQKKHVDAYLPYLCKDAALKLTHRLDKDTSGVLVLAKGTKSAEQLTAQFARKEIEKIYAALVIGVPRPREGVIDAPLAKGAEGMQEKIGVDEEGKRAISEYRVREAVGKSLAWMELKPVTGRTHQLRVHMAHIGHPIVGDGKYGGAEAFVRSLGLPEQLHLHAEKIILPRTGKKPLEIIAPWPAHMQESNAILGK